jgi:[histone H3]-lysine4 N-trimethyltransferase ASH1L
MKRWQKEGLYVGQAAETDYDQNGRKKLQKKRPGSSDSHHTTGTATATDKPAFMTLPMFAYLDKTRDFTIPFDVFAPTFKKGDEKPKDWHQVNRNRLIGEAKDLWEKSERLPASMCVCPPPTAAGELGCDEVCLNRVMQYECNDDNCNLPAEQCGNRAFAELATRTKKGGPYDVGVEVIKTDKRGFGVRSCRTWAPGQVIMEYTGEIISEGECQRRMQELYKDKQCYYLMELERGLIIDGTKGSMARFINHSCEPNCEVRMVKVNGTPRMGVFAGEAGIMTGQELTYDYNFDNFGTMQQKCFCGAASCRGTLSKRLNAAEQKKALREEMEKKRKAAAEAQKHAEAEEKKRIVKDERGSGWRGWVSVDDPETKARLKAEKSAKEAAAMNSSRAQRLAARRTSLPPAERVLVKKEKREVKRRKTVHGPSGKADAVQVEEDGPEDEEEGASEGAEIVVSSPHRPAKRTASGESKFTEDFEERPATATSSITCKTKVTVTQTETVGMPQDQADEMAQALLSSLPPTVDEVILATQKMKSPIKDAMKSVGQAVKNGLLGRSSSTTSGGKLRQSTLNFGRVARE